MKQIFSCNGYPSSFIKQGLRRRPHRNLPSTTRRVCLPYVQGTSEAIGGILRRFEINVFDKPTSKIGTFLPLPKDKLSQSSARGVVYSIPCGGCETTYIRQTGNSFDTRLSQHKAALRLLHPERCAVAKHTLEMDHPIKWDEAKMPRGTKRQTTEKYW